MQRIIVSFLLAGLLAPMAAGAQEVPQVIPWQDLLPVVEAAPAQQLPVVGEPTRADKLLAAVRAARPLLQTRLAERALKPVRNITDRDTFVDVVLAVWDERTGTIDLVDVQKNGKQLKMVSSYAYPIVVEQHNGANSYYKLPANSGRVVVGSIYPIMVEKREPIPKSKKEKVSWDLKDVIYVPYSPDFYHPVILAEGSQYLSNLIDATLQRLRALGVKSKAFPGRLLADVADPYLMKSLVVIEHSHTQLFADIEPERGVGRFLISMALNEGEAFNLSVSTAGARGLAQFIESTYERIKKAWPTIPFVADFREGMKDHGNALMAQVALLDSDLSIMPAAVKADYVAHREKAGPFLAASYNGGPSRVRRAFAEYGAELWSEDYRAQVPKMQARVNALAKKKTKTAAEKKEYNDLVAKIARAKKYALMSESAVYVQKLEKVYSMWLAGMFMTPQTPSTALLNGTNQVSLR